MIHLKLLLLTLLLSSGMAFGQDQIIEIEVADTIMSRADVFNYLIFVESQVGEKNVMKYLDNQKIEYRIGERSGSKGYDEYYMSFTSIEEIRNFNKSFQEDERIVQALSIGTYHEFTEDEISRLYHKIIKKGEGEAIKIAKAMGKIKVELVEAKYNMIETEKGGWTAYPPLSTGQSSLLTLPEDKQMKVKKSRMMTLRYRVDSK